MDQATYNGPSLPKELPDPEIPIQLPHISRGLLVLTSPVQLAFATFQMCIHSHPLPSPLHKCQGIPPQGIPGQSFLAFVELRSILNPYHLFPFWFVRSNIMFIKALTPWES